MTARNAKQFDTAFHFLWVAMFAAANYILVGPVAAAGSSKYSIFILYSWLPFLATLFVWLIGLFKDYFFLKMVGWQGLLFCSVFTLIWLFSQTLNLDIRWVHCSLIAPVLLWALIYREYSRSIGRFSWRDFGWNMAVSYLFSSILYLGQMMIIGFVG